MIRTTGWVATTGALMMLAACNAPEGTETNAAAPEAAATQSAEAGGVTREVAEPEAPAFTPMAAATPIQTQPGPDGSQLDLLTVKVTGDILTVSLRCSSADTVNTESFDLDDVSVIDDATAQRIAVLKDNDGKWLASAVSGDNSMVSCEQKPGVFWAKFPAPPATSKTVSINLPGTAPFDGVPVTR